MAYRLPVQRIVLRGQAGIVLAIFLIAQALDGALTYVGVCRFGLGVELNALLLWYIDRCGLPIALIGAKGLACVCGAVLHVTASHRALAVLTGAYLGVAVAPWLIALVPR